jgi:penicillin-binding protein 1A
MFVTRIVDNEGNVVARFTPRMNEVLSGDAADKMIYMLKGVVDGGTASRLRFRYGLTAELGGKTGTTNNNSDAWFMGVAPRLVSGCWVGGDDRDIHFDTMTLGQGAAMALPIYAYFMRRVYGDAHLGYTQEEKFDLPEDYNPCALTEDEGDEDAEVLVDDMEEVVE